MKVQVMREFFKYQNDIGEVNIEKINPAQMGHSLDSLDYICQKRQEIEPSSSASNFRTGKYYDFLISQKVVVFRKLYPLKILCLELSPLLKNTVKCTWI
jgi:hypothetical protein